MSVVCWSRSPHQGPSKQCTDLARKAGGCKPCQRNSDQTSCYVHDAVMLLGQEPRTWLAAAGTGAAAAAGFYAAAPRVVWLLLLLMFPVSRLLGHVHKTPLEHRSVRNASCAMELSTDGERLINQMMAQLVGLHLSCVGDVVKTHHASRAPKSGGLSFFKGARYPRTLKAYAITTTWTKCSQELPGECTACSHKVPLPC